MFRHFFDVLMGCPAVRVAVSETVRKLHLGSFRTRVNLGALERPPYAYCVYHGVDLARRLGHRRVSVIELGVAGGRGLLALEQYAQEASRELSVEIDVYGFDRGEGLPRPRDCRDAPFFWNEGFYKLDVARLQARLHKARLVIGDMRETAATFFEQFRPAPIAAVMFDLDFYSSTVDALRMFEQDEKYFLPRVFCCFDDVIGGELLLLNEYNGELLAIREFNDSHDRKKITAARHLLTRKAVEMWYHQVFVYHDFGHTRYMDFVGTGDTGLLDLR